jgi:phage N-6-adenine-methyltransferase
VSTEQLQLEIDWALLTRLEQDIGKSENVAVRARWLYGCELRDKVPLKQGVKGAGVLAIATELGVDENELYRRRSFAVAYPTEVDLSHAWERFGSWYEIVKNLETRAMGSSDSAEWPTPQWLFDVLDAEFRFTTDVCAVADYAKCDHYYSPEDNGLVQEWTGSCFMNPPYGDTIPQWMQKAWSSGQNGATVVCLVPARVDTAWWWDFARLGEIRFLRGRLKTGRQSWPFPSAVIVFPRQPSVVWWETE